jgi:hypothetical protein
MRAFLSFSAPCEAVTYPKPFMRLVLSFLLKELRGVSTRSRNNYHTYLASGDGRISSGGLSFRNEL